MSDLSNIKDNTLQLKIVSRNSKCCYILKQTYLMKQKTHKLLCYLKSHKRRECNGAPWYVRLYYNRYAKEKHTCDARIFRNYMFLMTYTQ